MAKVSPPPIQDPLTTPELAGAANNSWVLFFNTLFTGDTGTAWTPTFTGLTEAGGGATITGRYYKIGQSMAAFFISITPVTSTSAVAGTTLCDNFPLSIRDTGVVFAMANQSGTNSGECEASSNNIFTPAWTGVTVPVRLLGFCFT